MGVSEPRADGALIIQFAKAPLSGQVKTRMIPHLDAQQASELHAELLFWTAQTLCQDKLGAVELWLAGDADPEFTQSIKSLAYDSHRTQWGVDLGERMANAIEDGLGRYPKVVLVGSDCPSMDGGYLQSAIEALDHYDVVIGPAEDGGYVLIGARTVCAEIFCGVDWGRSTVFRETVEILKRTEMPWQTLSVLSDIDRPEDLPGWYLLRQAAGAKARTGKI
ncbi:MAG: rSAM/selenodomain-associated transferase 1 [Halioglobus sp.]|jgi:rSAM/selenodomain-associated transferase 1